jgi:hypothetical protein
METVERLEARGTLPSFQHFRGVEGRAGALKWEYEEWQVIYSLK